MQSGPASGNPLGPGCADGLGGATGRYVVIDWPDAAYLTVFAASVPEPGTLLLLAPGVTALAGLALRRRP